MNTRELGARAVAKAIDFYSSQGWAVFVPVVDTVRCDLVILKPGQTLRVEVKSTTQASGDVGLRTLGGNQSWSGVSSYLSASDTDKVVCVNHNTGTLREFDISELAGRTSVRVK